ncbi:MAG TPA: 4Fe-4S binding protein [Coriobacteriia bacterium]|jgi:polyferredoxin
MKRQRIRRKILFFSFFVFPITLNYFSPYLMTRGTAEHIATASLFVWAAVFGTSLFVGRGFCGWGCPFHGLQLCWEKVADKPLKRVRWLRAVPWVLWGLWVAAAMTVAVLAGGWRRVDLLYMTPVGVSVDSAASLITYYTLFGLALLPAALGRRGFCHYLCPFGVWSIVGTKIADMLRLPRLRLRTAAPACNSCGRCDRVCPMSVQIAGLASAGKPDHGDCILCGSCVDDCPRKALRFGFGRR